MNCPKKLTILKNKYSAKFHSEKVAILKKNNCRKEANVLEKELLKKSSCSEEVTAPKK